MPRCPVDWGTNSGWIGGIAGSILGVLGGLIGTWFSIKNTSGPRERAFMIKASVLCWLFVALFLAGLFIIPRWYNLLVWIPYVILLPLGILKLNATQQRIRQEESNSSSAPPP
jgi:hypothetical protein